MIRASTSLFVACVVSGALSLTGALAGGTAVPVPDFPVGGSNFYLSECSTLNEPKKSRCYVRTLLADIEKSGDPAREPPTSFRP